MAIELRRSHTGNVTLYVNGQPASAARFSGIQPLQDSMMGAVFIVPLDKAVFGEVDNVVPFVRPVPAVELSTRCPPTPCAPGS